VPRKLLKGPQTLLMAAGGVLAFPVMQRMCWNPYRAPSQKPALNWRPEGWMVVLVLMTGRLYGHLAWYGMLTGTEVFPEVPDLDAALASPADEAPFSGTCTPVQFARMELRRIGGVEVAPLPPAQAARIEARGNGCAIQEVSIANGLRTRPAGPDRPALRRFTVPAG
jgi:hypothetical protein